MKPVEIGRSSNILYSKRASFESLLQNTRIKETWGIVLHTTHFSAVGGGLSIRKDHHRFNILPHNGSNRGKNPNLVLIFVIRKMSF